MEIKEIIDPKFKDQWNQFVAGNTSPSSFLQSWNWGEFRREKLNTDIKRLIVYKDGELLAVAQFIKEQLPLGKFYWSCPRGPIVKTQNSNVKCQIDDVLKLLINEIKKTAKEEKIVFVRLELPYTNNYILPITDYKLQFPQILIRSKNPKNTLVLDLTKSEEEILTNMHQKTRYNIRLAEKNNIQVRFMNYDSCLADGQVQFKNKEIDDFYNILEETAKRDGIKIFSKNYYENLINYFTNYGLPITDYPPTGDLPQGDQLRINIFFAHYQDKILSTIMVIGFGDTATYLHGGSSDEYRELMPNYTIQWVAIRWAKEQGYKWYDFWGIQPTVNSQPPQMRGKQPTIKNNNWAGITRFKKGFVGEKTGQEINYLGALDYVINKKWYNLYYIAKFFTL